ncbi:MAG: hypothetical protein JNK73_01090 [Bacteroidia bacterium]|nr:hypothetical protein [Bacteroidia bacterium]
MRLLRILAVLLFGSFAGRAQYLDSLGEVIRGKANIDLRLESRWSFVNNELITISGVRIGAAFEKKLRLGGGLSWLKTPYSQTELTVNENGQTILKTTYFKLAYLAAYADVVFYKTKRWQLSVPLQIGAGFTWRQDVPQYQLNQMDSRQFLFLYEPGITVQFKLTRWFGLGSDVAYRFTLKNNKKISEQLSSPTYSFKIMFWLDQLYFMVFPESDWSRKSGPATW